MGRWDRTWLALAGIALLCLAQGRQALAGEGCAPLAGGGLACAPAVLADQGAVPGAEQGEVKGSVGMEAYGVDPAAVLGNRWGMDVRDEINRPVSARRLEKDLKMAAAQAAAESSYASRLPHAKAATLLMELLPAVDARLRNLMPSHCVATASAASVPKPPRLAPAALAAAFLALSSVVVRRPAPRTTGSASKAPTVLRC